MPKQPGEQEEPESFEGTSSLLGSARGQILSELCGKRLTAIELADRFSVTSNAIRTHLTALQSARLVRHEAETRGVGKPTHVYELTPEGQYLLSRAYAPALSYVLQAARARDGDRVDDLLLDAGRKLASARAPHRGRKVTLRNKAETCAAMLRALGGSGEVIEDPAGLLIRSECCPLASVVTGEPAACKLFEGLAREITGQDVREQCERQLRPHCRFVISRIRESA